MMDSWARTSSFRRLSKRPGGVILWEGEDDDQVGALLGTFCEPAGRDDIWGKLGEANGDWEAATAFSEEGFGGAGIAKADGTS